MKYTLIVLMAILAVSCNRTAESVEGGRFFDLSAFFNAEIERWGDTVTVVKIIHRDQVLLDSLVLNQYNVTEDLTEFSKSDINSPALSDSYTADTLLTDSLYWVSYNALTEKHPVRELTLGISPSGDVQIVRIYRVNESPVSDLNQEILYTTNNRYYINSNIIDHVGGKDLNIEISVEILTDEDQ